MKKLAVLMLALLIPLALAACAPEGRESEEGGGYGVWFAVEQDSGRGWATAVAREERVWEGEPTAQRLMAELLEGPESDRLYSPFPRGVAVRAISLEEATGQLWVDLSEHYGSLAGFDLTLADSCIALTLCQLPQVETVMVTVEGEPIPYRGRQALGEGDVLLSDVTQGLP